LIVRETDKAILFELHAIGTAAPLEKPYRNYWFPISQMSKIHRDSPAAENPADWILIKEWILKEKGLLDAPTIEQSQVPERFDDLPPWVKD
jgi:hypothetical protein